MEQRVDILVVGSGAGGLAAAVSAAWHGARVRVVEKAPVLGGTSAWSGGWLWIPRNPLAIKEGFQESAAAPLDYLRHEMGGAEADSRLRAFLEYGPQMVDFFSRHTEVQFLSGSRMPDFHEGPGAARGGRSVTARPYDGRRLGPWLHKLRPPLALISLAGMGIAGGDDMGHLFNALRSPRSALYSARRLTRHFWQRLRYGRGMHLVNGNALVARLLRSALDLGVELHTDAPVVGLIQEEGRIVGARIREDSGETIVRADAVILASGGFPHDRARLAEWVDHASDGYGHFSAAPATNSGDGIRLGEVAGGRMGRLRGSPMAWAPVSRVVLESGVCLAFPHLVERAKPGFIAVRADGQRFTNEADSYHDFIHALLAATPAGEAPCAWLIGDGHAFRRYGMGYAKPFPFPAVNRIREGYLLRGETLEALAQQCGIDPQGLRETVTAFNQHAHSGTDPRFGRGASAYNRAQGDARHGPNPSLGPLEKAPFYAVKMVPGSLGSFAGLETDDEARVLDGQQRPIAGLYAVGNDMSSVMQGYYPSGGITLGPAMTFGWLAGKRLGEMRQTAKNNKNKSINSLETVS